MTGSVSEYFRLIEERNEQYQKQMETQNMNKELTYHQACQRVRELRAAVQDITKSKGVRQPLFTELRKLENHWGLESIDYNGNKNSP